MDGVNPVRLETGLKLLVKAVGSACDLDYVIDDGAITIARRQTLQSLKRDAPAGPEAGGSSEQLAAKQYELNTRLDSCEMELAALLARRGSIEQQSAALKKMIDERLAGDSLLSDLKRFADLQIETEGKIRTLYLPGPAADKAAEEALDRMIKAKAELDSHREAVAKAAGGELLARLLSQLADISVRQAELEALRAAARDQLKKIVTSMTQRIERDLTMRSLKEAEERMFNLKQGLTNLQAPTITISGASD
jgi:hypothetical protein